MPYCPTLGGSLTRSKKILARDTSVTFGEDVPMVHQRSLRDGIHPKVVPLEVIVVDAVSGHAVHVQTQMQLALLTGFQVRIDRLEDVFVRVEIIEVGGSMAVIHRQANEVKTMRNTEIQCAFIGSRCGLIGLMNEQPLEVESVIGHEQILA